MKRTSNSLRKVIFLEDYRLRKQFTNSQRLYAANAYAKNHFAKGSNHFSNNKPFLAYDSKVVEKEERNSQLIVISFVVVLLAFLTYAAFVFDLFDYVRQWRIETLSNIEQWIKNIT